jgi:nitronate monooxygenase
LLNIEHPIIQAPVGGLARPELAAAVTNAGALGSLSGSLAPPEVLRTAVGQLRTLSNGPFNLNFLVYPQPDTS